MWVWSKGGIENQKEWEDPNRGHLIYEHQAIVELLEYGYMLHRSVIEQVSRYSCPEDVLSIREHLIRLQHDMGEASHFGEIRDLLESGWKAMGVPDLRERIQESLAVMESKSALYETRVTARLGLNLTILFGLLAVPALAESVIQPLWEILEWPKPTSKPWEQLLFILVASIIVALAIAVLLAARPRSRFASRK